MLATGNWDLVGNNTPIFFIRDPILFPSFIHTQKRNPATHLKDPDAMWDFITLRPETTHQVQQRTRGKGHKNTTHTAVEKQCNPLIYESQT